MENLEVSVKRTEKLIKLMEAFVNGESTEFRRIDSSDWYSTICPSWDFSTYEYRVAPKIPEYMLMNEKGFTYGVYHTLEKAMSTQSKMKGYAVFKLEKIEQ